MTEDAEEVRTAVVQETATAVAAAAAEGQRSPRSSGGGANRGRQPRQQREGRLLQIRELGLARTPARGMCAPAGGVAPTTTELLCRPLLQGHAVQAKVKRT